MEILAKKIFTTKNRSIEIAQTQDYSSQNSDTGVEHSGKHWRNLPTKILAKLLLINMSPNQIIETS